MLLDEDFNNNIRVINKEEFLLSILDKYETRKNMFLMSY
jgi:hypothetical protein